MMEEEKEFVNTTRPVPLWLPITGVVVLLLGLFVAPSITASFEEQQLSRNAILSGIQFLLVFIAIIIFYASLIWFLAYRLNGRVPERLFRIVEYVLIGGIIVGIIGMFQPWIFAGFRYGFYLLLASTIGYIAWSHITPAAAEDDTAAMLGTIE